MGTLLFIFLRGTGIIEFAYDMVILCVLVSLDSIALAIWASRGK